MRSECIKVITKRIITETNPLPFEIYNGFWNLGTKVTKILGVYGFAQFATFSLGYKNAVGRLVIKHSDSQYQQQVFSGHLNPDGTLKKRNIDFGNIDYSGKSEDVEYFYENNLNQAHDLIILIKTVQRI